MCKWCVCSVLGSMYAGHVSVFKNLPVFYCLFFFFQAEDGIRDLVRSRGLGDVYKRQPLLWISITAVLRMISARPALRHW